MIFNQGLKIVKVSGKSDRDFAPGTIIDVSNGEEMPHTITFPNQVEGGFYREIEAIENATFRRRQQFYYNFSSNYRQYWPQKRDGSDAF